ncbi:unnamed protein product [Pleuronectes platessa]|uniref:Uncharacterized protein n=1 Tax=Pleuronectes platessa TaxID=8262 RepID=A0A9N7VIR3_PLEPL|nr:unnamed protein product [Pleuronectes platessa]
MPLGLSSSVSVLIRGRFCDESRLHTEWKREAECRASTRKAFKMKGAYNLHPGFHSEEPSLLLRCRANDSLSKRLVYKKGSWFYIQKEKLAHGCHRARQNASVPKEQSYKRTVKKLVLSIIANPRTREEDQHLRGTPAIGSSELNQ